MSKISARLPLIILVPACFVLLSCGGESDPLPDVTQRVKYFVVGEEATGQSRRISGKLAASNSSPLGFGVNGAVAKVIVSQGDVVRQGQLLATLDQVPFRLSVEQARAQLNGARAKATETKQLYDRIFELSQKGVTSQAEVDTATANHSVALGTLRSAQSDLDRKERDLSLSELTAPFSGTIAVRSIDPFQDISVGQEAFVLQTADLLDVEVRVPETLIRDVDYGQVVQVTFPILDGVVVSGVVDEIGSTAESGNAFPVRIRVSPTDVDLHPGMTASVTFNFDEYLDGRNVYLIPLSAIAIEIGVISNARAPDEDSSQRTAPVFVIGPDNQLQVREIAVGDLRGNQLEVYDGLEPGEKIVSAGVAFLREGMTVELWTPELGLADE
jgi:RND family efflux transporter MFP subunit